MIMVASQRGGTRQLAAHLLNDRDNDHVTLHELRGFMADDLKGAMTEAHALAKGTRCQQPVFSLSLNPPKDAPVSLEEFVAAADRAEEKLGLKDQPRAIVIHEKEGRRHAHVVWSRIDTDQMKAINLPHFKLKLNSLSKELFLEHEWDLPEGYRTNGWKNPLNFTLADWQQAKRLDLDPREIKQALQSAWQQSDNLKSFQNALEERGYHLAKGDRRGFVVMGAASEPMSLSRWLGVKPKELEARLGKPERLPGVEKTKATLNKGLRQNLTKVLKEDRQRQADAMKEAKAELRSVVQAQRVERLLLERKQRERWTRETRQREGKLRKGLGKVMDILTGRLFAVRRENEREAMASLARDRDQRETLFEQQFKERAPYQERIDALRDTHRLERQQLARRISWVLEGSKREAEKSLDRDKGDEPEMEMR